MVKARVKELDKFGDFKTIDALAGGDVTKYDEVLKIPLNTALLKLYYSKEVNDFRERLSVVHSNNARNEASRKRQQ
jgi:hypothetical protein